MTAPSDAFPTKWARSDRDLHVDMPGATFIDSDQQVIDLAFSWTRGDRFELDDDTLIQLLASTKAVLTKFNGLIVAANERHDDVARIKHLHRVKRRLEALAGELKPLAASINASRTGARQAARYDTQRLLRHQLNEAIWNHRKAVEAEYEPTEHDRALWAVLDSQAAARQEEERD